MRHHHFIEENSQFYDGKRKIPINWAIENYLKVFEELNWESFIELCGLLH
jgi:hypothetical protein